MLSVSRLSCNCLLAIKQDFPTGCQLDKVWREVLAFLLPEGSHRSGLPLGNAGEKKRPSRQGENCKTSLGNQFYAGVFCTGWLSHITLWNRAGGILTITYCLLSDDYKGMKMPDRVCSSSEISKCVFVDVACPFWCYVCRHIIFKLNCTKVEEASSSLAPVRACLQGK